MWFFLALIWLDAEKRARESTDLRDIWAGARYRVTGDVQSRSPLDPRQLQQLINLGPVTDFQIGQRPPYRFAFTVKATRSLRLRLPFSFTDPSVGATILIREIRELPSTEAQV